MNKLGLIIKREYLAKVRNKSFVIMTFLSPVLMVGMIVLIAYLTEINDREVRVLGVLNESVYYSKDFTSTESMSFVQFEDVTLEQAKDSVISQNFVPLTVYCEKRRVPSTSASSLACQSSSSRSPQSPSACRLSSSVKTWGDAASIAPGVATILPS